MGKTVIVGMGALGLLFYLAWLVFSARDILRRGDPLPLALLAGLAGYAVQAAVNIAQTPGTALLFLLLAIARRKSAAGGH